MRKIDKAYNFVKVYKFHIISGYSIIISMVVFILILLAIDHDKQIERLTRKITPPTSHTYKILKQLAPNYEGNWLGIPQAPLFTYEVVNFIGRDARLNDSYYPKIYKLTSMSTGKIGWLNESEFQHFKDLKFFKEYR